MNCHVQGLLLAAAVILVPAVSTASHYDIASSGIVDEQVATRLADNGIHSTKDLWGRTATRTDRARLAIKVKVKAAEVARWHDFCDLLRLTGVGPKVARVMTAAGVHNLKELAVQNADALAAKIAQVRDKVPELGKLPDGTNIQSWIDQAVGLLKADAAAKSGAKK